MIARLNVVCVRLSLSLSPQQAQVYYAGQSRYIGVFETREQAALAYEMAREQLKADSCKDKVDRYVQALQDTTTSVTSVAKRRADKWAQETVVVKKLKPSKEPSTAPPCSVIAQKPVPIMNDQSHPNPQVAMMNQQSSFAAAFLKNLQAFSSVIESSTDAPSSVSPSWPLSRNTSVISAISSDNSFPSTASSRNSSVSTNDSTSCNPTLIKNNNYCDSRGTEMGSSTNAFAKASPIIEMSQIARVVSDISTSTSGKREQSKPISTVLRDSEAPSNRPALLSGLDSPSNALISSEELSDSFVFPSAVRANELTRNTNDVTLSKVGQSQAQFLQEEVKQHANTTSFVSHTARAGAFQIAAMGILPRGITIRPSGRWQAQLYYCGTSRYIGVFDNREKAVLAYEIVREKLRDDPEKSSTTCPMQAKQNFEVARRAAFAGVHSIALKRTQSGCCE